MGTIVSIIIGAVCGAIASKLMNSKGGLLFYVIAGVVGGALGSFVAKLLGLAATGIIGQLIIGVLGTCLLIWLCRLIFKK